MAKSLKERLAEIQAKRQASAIEPVPDASPPLSSIPLSALLSIYYNCPNLSHSFYAMRYLAEWLEFKPLINRFDSPAPRTYPAVFYTYQLCALAAELLVHPDDILDFVLIRHKNFFLDKISKLQDN